MLKLARTIHNRRPLLWTVIAFVVVVALLMTMSIWWNYLLVQNSRIVGQMTAAATRPEGRDIPLAILMILGILCSVVVLLGLVYMFLRLIRAVQLNLAQSQFIAAVTHELRSPVASLQLMFQTIRDPGTSPEVRRDFENCIDADLARLRLLVDQVLDTARLENTLGAATRERCSVAELLRKCTETMSARLKTTASTLAVGAVPPSLTVMANPGLLSTALTNVLDNAIKYSNGPADVSVRVIDEDTAVVIEVQDKGIGISHRELKRVFRRFYRGGDPLTHSRPGTGLGLYFARLAVLAQGGRISIHSAGYGMGTTFRIQVPKS